MIEINATLFAQIIHFLLLVVLFTWIAYNPISKILADRQAHIRNAIDDAERQQREAVKLKEEYQTLLVQARTEAQSIVEKATKLAEQERDQIIGATKEETAKLLRQAQAEIQREQERALVRLRDEVAALSVLAAGKIIGQTIDAKSQEKLIEDFINQLDDLGDEGAGRLPC